MTIESSFYCFCFCLRLTQSICMFVCHLFFNVSFSFLHKHFRFLPRHQRAHLRETADHMPETGPVGYINPDPVPDKEMERHKEIQKDLTTQTCPRNQFEVSILTNLDPLDTNLILFSR